MKSQMKFITCIKSVASLLVLGGFIWLAAGSLTVPYTVTKVLPDGRFEETERFMPWRFTTIETITTGYKDGNGFWKGNVEILDYSTYKEEKRALVRTSSGPCADGCKHGNWTIIRHAIGITEYIIFDHDKEVGRWKMASFTASAKSAFEIIQSKYSLYLNKLEFFTLTNEEIRTYTDSLEAILSRKAFDSAGFDQNYSDARDKLGDFPAFDSISNIISEINYSGGLYRIKRNELRLAVLQRNRNGSGTTYASVESTYPGYLAYMNANLVTNPEFDGFCQVLDSTMDSYGPLNKDDAFFIDSVDTRLFRALSDMGSKSPAFGSLQSLKTSVEVLRITEVRNEAVKLFKRLKSLETAADAALNLCLADMLVQYDEADLIKAAVKEACFLKREWSQLPVLTTVYSCSNSLTSVTIRGNVIESGGSDVTSRGIAWAGTYNPTLDNHVVNSGSGAGNFLVTIDGLEPGKTYYARSFATNRAGTAYGNIVEFTTERASSANIPDLTALSLSVYPNPAFHWATLNYSAELPGNYMITIINMNGQVVYSTEIRHPEPGIYSISVDLSSFPGGIFSCRVSNGTSTSVCKVLKAE